jgi:hypothetical protein
LGECGDLVDAEFREKIESRVVLVRSFLDFDCTACTGRWSARARYSITL